MPEGTILTDTYLESRRISVKISLIEQSDHFEG
jgi:hypothetical protein